MFKSPPCNAARLSVYCQDVSVNQRLVISRIDARHWELARSTRTACVTNMETRTRQRGMPRIAYAKRGGRGWGLTPLTPALVSHSLEIGP